MVTARKPRSNANAAARRSGGASASARRAPAKRPEPLQRKIDRIIKRRAPALRELD
jgi:hypothetical protein